MRDRPWQIHPNALTNRIVTELISDVYQGSNGYYFRFKMPAARVPNHLFYFRLKFVYWIPLKWFDSTWNARNDFFLVQGNTHVDTDWSDSNSFDSESNLSGGKKSKPNAGIAMRMTAMVFAIRIARYSLWCLQFKCIFTCGFYTLIIFIQVRRLRAPCACCNRLCEKLEISSIKSKFIRQKKEEKKKPQHRNDNERSKMTFQRCQNRNFARIVVFVVLVIIRPSRQSLVCC